MTNRRFTRLDLLFFGAFALYALAAGVFLVAAPRVVSFAVALYLIFVGLLAGLGLAFPRVALRTS